MPRPLRSPDSPAGTSGRSAFDCATLQLHDGALRRPENLGANGLARPGRNFAAQDYLDLGSDPAVRSAVLAAAGQQRLTAGEGAAHCGPDGSATLLETRIAGFLNLPAAMTFGSATQAIRAVLASVIRQGDQVIIDSAAHPAFFEATRSARALQHRSPAGSVEAVERRLLRLSRQRSTGRIFIVVPAISAHASRMAELAELSALARAHGALLVADVTHDLGAMGPGGGGVMEIQGCMGRIDIVLGSFAKSFASPGGFAAFRDPALKPAPHPAHAYPSAIPPLNPCVVLAALDIIDSPEGRRRRRCLHGNALRLRNHLMADGFRVMGQASPLVLVRLPRQSALQRTELLESAGPRVTLLQAPLVPGHAPRWRFQLNSAHGAADIDDLAELIRDVARVFDRQPRLVQPVEPATQL